MPAAATYISSFPIGMPIPWTPRSPKPRIRLPSVSTIISTCIKHKMCYSSKYASLILYIQKVIQENSKYTSSGLMVSTFYHIVYIEQQVKQVQAINAFMVCRRQAQLNSAVHKRKNYNFDAKITSEILTNFINIGSHEFLWILKSLVNQMSTIYQHLVQPS